MGEVRIARLDLRLWRPCLQDFLYDCAASTPGEQADRIREAHTLLRSAPENLPIADLPGERAVEAMLAASAYASASLTLLGGKTAFMLSRGLDGSSLATVVLPGQGEEMTAEGETPALALLAALASALLAVAERSPNELKPADSARKKAGFEAGRRV